MSRQRRFYRADPAGRRAGARRGRIALGAAVLIAALLLLLGDNGLLAVLESQRERDRVGAELAATRAAAEAVRERRDALQRRGSEVLEEVGREQYQLRAPGEQVIDVIVPGEGPAGPLDKPAGPD